VFYFWHIDAAIAAKPSCTKANTRFSLARNFVLSIDNTPNIHYDVNASNRILRRELTDPLSAFVLESNGLTDSRVNCRVRARRTFDCAKAQIL